VLDDDDDRCSYKSTCCHTHSSKPSKAGSVAVVTGSRKCKWLRSRCTLPSASRNHRCTRCAALGVVAVAAA